MQYLDDDGEAESILSKVLGGNKLLKGKKYHAPSESSEYSESSCDVTGKDLISCLTLRQHLTHMILGSSTDRVQPKVSRQGKRKEGMEDLKSHRCDQCGYSAKYAGRVREHRRRVHEKIKQFRCREGGRVDLSCS